MTLSACGGVLGLLLAGFGCPAIRNFGTSDIPRLPDAHISWPVILFTAGITIFTALAASLWPALHRGRARLVSRQSVSPSTRTAGDLLVAGEFALALILIISATLLIRSVLHLRPSNSDFGPTISFPCASIFTSAAPRISRQATLRKRSGAPAPFRVCSRLLASRVFCEAIQRTRSRSKAAHAAPRPEL